MKERSKFIRLAMVSSSILATVSLGSSVAFAGSTASTAAHKLPILSELPVDGQVEVKPTSPITIALDTSSPNFARYREQFVKGQFTVSLNGQSTNASYDESSNTITVQHSTLQRYTTYTVALSVKNDTESFTFETGSAIGEATHATASVQNAKVSVDTGGVLDVTATDDYGDPATNATVTVTGTGSFDNFNANPLSGSITTGAATITLNDHKAELVTLTYAVKDNTYGDVNSDSSIDETFVPGAPAYIQLQPAQPTISAGTDDVISGSVHDQYGNLATNDTDSASVSVNDGQQVSVPISNGTFIYTLAANDDHIAGQYSVTSKDNKAEGSSVVAVTPGAPDASQSVVTFPSGAVDPGSAYTVSGTVKDSYGNVIPNQAVEMSLDGKSATTNSGVDGTFTVSVTPTKTNFATATISAGSVRLGSTAVTVGSPVTQADLTAAKQKLWNDEMQLNKDKFNYQMYSTRASSDQQKVDQLTRSMNTLSGEISTYKSRNQNGQYDSEIQSLQGQYNDLSGQRDGYQSDINYCHQQMSDSQQKQISDQATITEDNQQITMIQQELYAQSH